MIRVRMLIAISVIVINPFSIFAQRITGLSCNYDRNPVAVDDQHPRLSWQLIASERNVNQAAYQVLVATSIRQLSQNIGDVWDSKKVDTDQSLYVPYKGAKLMSSRKYYWKVRVWNKSNVASAWSEVAHWQMGLLHPADWKAKWITASKWFTPVEYRPKGFQVEGRGGWADIDLGRPLLVDSIRLFPLNGALFPLRFRIMGSNEFNFIHQDILSDQTQQDYVLKGSGYQVFTITPAIYRFIRIEIIGNTQNIKTTVRQLEIFSGGINVALMKFTREYNTDWAFGHAVFLVDGMPSQNEGSVCPVDACPTIAAPLFRKTFHLEKKIKRATIYFAALGMADVSINGQKVGCDELGPPYTDYYKRIMYVTYDVTPLLKQGQNTIGAVLGNGFFSTPGLGFGQRQNGNGPPRFLLQTLITFTDGSQKIIATDDTWKWAKSEITFNDVWQGYSEDRNLSKPGWDKDGYNDLHWAEVKIAATVPGQLVARTGTPNRVNGIIKPVSVKDNHAYFKTTSVGWPILKLNGKAGQIITITGVVSPEYAMAKLTFTLAKDGLTTLSPRFIIQPGPTDMKIEGLISPLKIEDIGIQYINAALSTSGTFNCSNPYLDSLFDAAMRTHRNYINDFPADPNREKQGWTQDAQNMFNTAAYFTDVRAMYSRWWDDMADNQDERGYLGTVVPMVNRQVYDWNSPWWSGMIVYLPWEHYQYYGNVQILEKGYNAMCRYVDLLDKLAETGDGTPWDDYTYFTKKLDTAAAKEKMLMWNGAGDWLNPYNNTQFAVPAPMTTMPAWYYYATIVSKTAKLLGKEADAIKYGAMAEDVKTRFTKKYYHPETGLYGDSTNSQTGQVLPLAVGMVPAGKEDITYQRLIDAIHQRDDHVGTGFTSLAFMLKILAAHRESALANRIINQKDYPSWNTLMGRGVFLETWNGEGAQMPSCGGAIGAWLFQSVLGIQPDKQYPGFKQFILSPQPDKSTGLISARGSYKTNYGEIKVDWKCENDKFIIDIDIPANTSAKVYIPTDDLSSVSESSIGVKNNIDIQTCGYSQGVAAYLVKSGKYHFETKYDL